MKGMYFVLMQQPTKDGQISFVNQGVIADKLTDEKFLCTFAMGEKTHSCIVTLDELSEYKLFGSAEELNNFMASFAPKEGEKTPRKPRATKSKTKGKTPAADKESASEPVVDPEIPLEGEADEAGLLD